LEYQENLSPSLTSESGRGIVDKKALPRDGRRTWRVRIYMLRINPGCSRRNRAHRSQWNGRDWRPSTNRRHAVPRDQIVRGAIAPWLDARAVHVRSSRSFGWRERFRSGRV